MSSITLPVSIQDGYLQLLLPQPLNIQIPLTTPNFATSIQVKINNNIVPNIIMFSLTDTTISWQALGDPILANVALLAAPNSFVEFSHGSNHFQASCTLQGVSFQGSAQGDLVNVQFKITGANQWTVI